MFKHSHRIFNMSLTILVIITSIYSSTLNTLYNQDPVAEAASQKTCNWKWRRVPSPNAGTKNNRLNELTVVGANDNWAVGYSSDTNDILSPLIEHWDGQQWYIVPTPNPDPGSSNLSDISAVNANDIWAVGYTYFSPGFKPLAMRWNGVTWTMVSLPEELGDADLSGVKATDTDDVWMVGGYGTPKRHPLILHWDGTNWLNVSPFDSITGALSDMVVLDANNIWAVGTYTPNPSAYDQNTFIIHYDGVSWSIIPSPNGDYPFSVNQLYGIASLSPSELWAVGMKRSVEGSLLHDGLLLHWDGSQWTLTEDAMPNDYFQGLNDVAGLDANNIWAAGEYRSSPFLENWNGVTWENLSPNNGLGSLWQLGLVDANNLWAVGELYTGVNEIQTLIVQGHLRCGRIVQCEDAPILLYPTPNMVAGSDFVRLDWKNSKCATHYQVQVRRNSSEGKLVKRVTKDRVSEYIFVRPTIYHKRFVWRVRACNAQGCGKWSEWRKFRIQTEQNASENSSIH